MKKCIKKNDSMTCRVISEKEGTPSNTDIVPFDKEDIEWWFNEENSYSAGLNCIDGNWYYFLFRMMYGSWRR